MADFFRRLSEQVLNRAAVVQPLRASRFALVSEMNLSTPTQLRQVLTAPVHHHDARGAASAFAPGRLPGALVPPESPYNTWRIPSLRQLEYSASATGNTITPHLDPPYRPIGDIATSELTTRAGESTETLAGAGAAVPTHQITGPHVLSSLVAPSANVAPPAPDTALPRAAPVHRHEAQFNPIPQENAIAPIQSPAPGQATMAEPKATPLSSAGDVTAGSATVNDTPIAPNNLPGTPRLTAIQLPQIALATETSRPVALQVTPVLPKRDRALAPASALERPSEIVAMPERMAAAIDPPIDEAPSVARVAGALPENRIIPTPQVRAQNLYEALITPVSAPSDSGRRGLSNVETAENAFATDQTAASLVPIAENRRVRDQRQKTSTTPVNPDNAEVVHSVPQMLPALVRSKEERLPVAEMFEPVVIASPINQPTASSSIQALSAAKHDVSAARNEPPRTLAPTYAVNDANASGNQRDTVNRQQPLVQPNLAGGSLTPVLSDLSTPLPAPLAPLARGSELRPAVDRVQPVEKAPGVLAGEVGQPTASQSPREAGSAETVLLHPRASLLAQPTPARQQLQPAAEITVRVTIGRVEVRQAAEPPPPTTRRRTTQPVLSLDDYLARAQRGQA